ncbi:hypothetical protein SPRG_01460 [Saprolegnia parasitica CBS 223.65]|uniref:Uncharacterized protein n=1 Tax=Saprolegnia parasitica (strain CBS 223.65) TaxID=695850 RepID=A0A067CYJ2_SAPPC|nr:hypothetical protein SPRG_01460 [Saprolegnia parasitica CBS 223.65]KDO34325.1 hypothetical protein SPRG_01460 [Saprolegnia parasitica CBS 223.65]|eukprot:XP_012195062.1 hypothetical protein SPRG_01460 [Saprolegnia parasitica CBS 223.65]
MGAKQSLQEFQAIPLVPTKLGGLSTNYVSTETATFVNAPQGFLNVMTGGTELGLRATSGLLSTSAQLVSDNSREVVATIKKALVAFRATYHVYAGESKTELLKLVVHKSYFGSTYTCNVSGNGGRYTLVCKGKWSQRMLITCNGKVVAKIRPPPTGTCAYLDVAAGVDAAVLCLVQHIAVQCDRSKASCLDCDDLDVDF